MEIKEILNQCIINNNIVKLPNITLDRKTYLKVKEKMEIAGGKWKSGKTQGFVFKNDPTELFEALKNEDSNIKKNNQLFFTPSDIAEKVVYYACIQNHDTVLEPSCGQGAIIKAINEQSVVVPDCYELTEINKICLKNSGLRYNLIGDDFLKSDNKTYDKIIANPPFSKNQDIIHFYKMYDKLSRGGRIVSIMSRHWLNSNNKREQCFRDFLEKNNAEIIELEAGAFKKSGTNIASLIVILNKEL